MNTKLFFLISFLAGMVNCSSCHDEIPTEMPPETQTGANTFGCLIDGELFVGGCCAPWMSPVLSVTYRPASDHLGITIWGKMNGNPAGAIEIGIDSFLQNSTHKSYFANYYPHGSKECPNYSVSNDGICIITKLDTLNKIVSGRFEFVGRCADWNYNIMDSTMSIQITQGRFDFKYDTYNE